MTYYIETKCRCGVLFKRLKHTIQECPEDYMCNECNKHEDWRFHLRCLRLNKIRCVKCGWKLKEKNSVDSMENTITMKCPCCGFNFSLHHDDIEWRV